MLRRAIPASLLLLFLAAGLAPATAQAVPTFTIESVTTQDADNNGYFDHVLVKFTQDMDVSTAAKPTPADLHIQPYESDDLPFSTITATAWSGARTLVVTVSGGNLPFTGAVDFVDYVGPSSRLKTAASGVLYDESFLYDRIDDASPVLLRVEADLSDQFGDGPATTSVGALVSEPLDVSTLEGNVVLKQGASTVAFETGSLDEQDGILFGEPVSALSCPTATSCTLEVGAGVLDLAGKPFFVAPPQGITDVAILTLTPDAYDTLELDESGAQASRQLTVTSNLAPEAPLDLRVRATAETPQVTLSASSVTLTASQKTRQVTVTAIADKLVDGTQDDFVGFTFDFFNHTAPLQYFAMWEALSGEGYGWFFEVADKDLANFTVTPGTASSAEGAFTTLNVALTAKPAAGLKVVLDVKSLDANLAALNKTRLTFGSGNWSVAQKVKVAGVSDLELDGTKYTNVTFVANRTVSGRDAAWDYSALRRVQVTITDNNTAKLATDVAKATVGENAGTAIVKVKLGAKPAFGTATGTNLVRVKAASSQPSLFTVSPATLDFTATNWDVLQTVTLTGVNDSNLTGLRAASLLLTVNGTASVNAYDAVTLSVPVNVTDDEVGVLATGLPATLREGDTATLTLRLSTAPPANSNVTVAVTPGPGLSATPLKAVFGPGNWSAGKTFTIKAVEDTKLLGDRESNVAVTVTAGPSAFTSVAAKFLSLTVQDDDDDALTSAAMQAANAAIALEVTRSGGDPKLAWTLPTTTPAPPAGVQVWRSTGTTYTLVKTIAANDTAFASGSYVDADAPAKSRYRLTMYYAPVKAFGFAGQASDIGGFDALTAELAPAASNDAALPLAVFGVGAVAFVAALVGALVITLRARP